MTFRTEKKVEVGKKISHRPKERIAFVQNAHSRSCTLYKRKKTLFDKGLRLHAMTKSEVLIIIDQPNGQRFVCGSNVILDNYKKGNLRPAEKDKTYEGSTTISPNDSDMPGVEPLDNTPDRIDIDQCLASVLGHETTTAPAAKPVSRCRRHLPLDEVSNAALQVPAPVKELLLNRLIPQLTEQEKEEVAPIQKQSRINFISDKDVVLVVQQKKLSKNTAKLPYKTMTEVTQ